MNNPPIIPWLLALLLGGTGCNLPPAQVTTDAVVIGQDACTLTAAIAKIVDPTGSENQVLAIACPDVVPTVNLVSHLVTGAADGTHAQCSAWATLDDSKRFGGNGKARAGQVVCANLKAAVEAELAKPPAARR